jgi:hypothetical protein
MAKKKASGKSKAKKPEKEQVSAGKPLDAAQVREQIAGMVMAKAMNLATAVVDNATAKGDLAPAKYFLEMAKIFPVPEGGEGTNQDSLARTLMQALGIPEEPISEDGDGNVVSPQKVRDGV